MICRFRAAPLGLFARLWIEPGALPRADIGLARWADEQPLQRSGFFQFPQLRLELFVGRDQAFFLTIAELCFEIFDLWQHFLQRR